MIVITPVRILALTGVFGVFLTAPVLAGTAAQDKDPGSVPSWTVVPKDSKITFQGTGPETGDFSGTFEKWTAQIVFLPENLAKSHVTVRIDTGSLTMTEDGYAKTLRGSGWLDAAQFPEAVFESSAFEKTGSTEYRATGTLSLHGVQKTIGFPFSLTIQSAEKGKAADMTSTFALDRNEYGIGTESGESVVDRSIKVNVTLRAVSP